MLDKRLVWGTVTAIVEGAVGPATYHMLLSACYLESLEGSTAVIAAESRVLLETIRRKSAHQLRLAFEEYLNRPIKVQFALGHPRIFENAENTRNEAGPIQDPDSDAESAELAMLHAKYGDIMGIVDNHPVCRKACTPVAKGGWGIFPQLLTNACKDYGVMTVLKGLRFIANRPSAINPRALFFTALRKGQFGTKLRASVSMVGKDSDYAPVASKHPVVERQG